LENLLPVELLVRTNFFIPSRFYLRDAVSAVIANVAGWLAGWLGVRQTSVLYQNG